MTREVRLRRWMELLHEQKTSGQSIKSWCETQGISRQRFFYWQRKLREAASALTGREMSVTGSPAGWALCAPAEAPDRSEPSPPSSLSDQVCVEINGMRIMAGHEYAVEKLAQLLRELSPTC
jgi:transposase-like protein